MAAVMEDGTNLAFASFELRNDKEIVKQAVKQNGITIDSVMLSKELKDDKEIVMIALETWSNAFACASDRLKNDRDVILKAVSHGFPITKISNTFNTNRELLLASSKVIGYSTLEFACSELRNDKELVMQAIQTNPFAFEKASNELRNDREFVKELVMINGECLKFASKELRNDREIVELALKTSPDVIYYISDRFRQDSEYISRLIGKRGFKQLPNEFSNDREIVLESIKLNSTNLFSVSKVLRNDREFTLQAVKNCGMTFRYINDVFKSDREIVMEAVKQDGDVIEYIPDQFFNDEEILIKAAETATINYFTSFYYKLSNRLQSDREFLMKCAPFFYSFPRKYQLLDRELVMEALKTNCNIPYAFSWIARERGNENCEKKWLSSR